jgi:hypothetical protein
MIIQDALKPTGKAECDEDGYVFVDEYGILRWYDTVNNTATGAAELNEILNSDWLPYHEEEEIRPEKAGELWQQTDHNGKVTTSMTVEEDETIRRVYESGIHDGIDEDWQIHNKNGWTRLFPSVEDESMKRVPVVLRLTGGGDSFSSMEFDIGKKCGARLKGKTVFLEIPKEQ